MQPKNPVLTEYGIKKIMENPGFDNPILQIISFNNNVRQIKEKTYYSAEISDGHAKLRCVFDDALNDRIEKNSRKINNQIVMLKKYGTSLKSIVVYDYDVVLEDYKEVIGKPVEYKVFKLESSHKPIVPAQTPTAKKRFDPGDPKDYDSIADLYPDLQNLRIYCRVYKVNYSQFQAKSGRWTKLLSMQLMDRKGSTIKASIFGDYAEKMSHTIKFGQTFIFSKGLVKTDDYNKGTTSSEYSITFTESSRIIPSTDDHSIKNPEAAYLTIEDLKLKLKQVNASVDFVGIVKQIGNIHNISSKDKMKQLRKRTLLVCDPVQKLEIDAVLWNDAADLDERVLHKTVLLTEFKVHQYNGSISINSSIKSKIIELQSHPYKNFQEKISSEQFRTLSWRRDQNNDSTIKNIKGIQEHRNEIEDGGSVWADLKVYVNKIKEHCKRTYQGCPHCKKTVQPDDTQCQHCSKPFIKPQTRYILNIEVSDYSGSIWTTAYDQFAERIFRIVADYPAEAVKNMSDKDFDSLVSKCLFQEFRIKTVSKLQTAPNGQRRIKHNVAKVYPFNYIEQANSNLQYIRKRI